MTSRRTSMGAQSSTLSPRGTPKSIAATRNEDARRSRSRRTSAEVANYSSSTAGASSHQTSHHRPCPKVTRPPLSDFSSRAVEDSIWFASDFMVGAGMVIIQPTTGRVVLLRDSDTGRWLLPKGRKDIGESLEQAALREAYEESGFQAEFLPLVTPTNQPGAPDSPHRRELLPNTEPVFISTLYWRPRKRPTGQPPCAGDKGGEYLTYWYVGQIAADAKPNLNANMANEESYITHLMDIKDALRALQRDRESLMFHIVSTAYTLWQDTNKILEIKAAQASSPDLSTSSSDDSLASAHTSSYTGLQSTA